ncbi:MAG: AlwI family type II restriction endonuclease, partial [Thermoplasmatales archaeon]
EEGGKASWTTIYAKWVAKTASYSDIYVGDLLDEALSHFPANTNKGVYMLGDTLTKVKRTEEIVKEIRALVEATRAKSSTLDASLLPIAMFGRAIKEKMKLPIDYLADWKTSPQDVLTTLTQISRNLSTFLNKYKNKAAAEFEFLTAKSMCILFQLPLLVEQGPSGPKKESCVVWRGEVTDYQASRYAPGGASDILVHARGPYYVLIEATLRYSQRQWKEEIEPITRHQREFITKYRLSKEDVYLAFVVTEALSDTYDWLHPKADTYHIVILDVESLLKIVTASLHYWGMPHLQIRRLLDQLSRRMALDDEVDLYTSNLVRVVDQWCREILEPNMPTFLAIKAYRVLKSRGGIAKVMDVSNELAGEVEVRQYLSLLGRNTDYIEKKKQNWLHQLTLLGLAREIDNMLIALTLDEFESRLLKALGYVSRIAST